MRSNSVKNLFLSFRQSCNEWKTAQTGNLLFIGIRPYNMARISKSLCDRLEKKIF